MAASLPPLDVLRVFPSPLAIERSVSRHTETCATLDGAVTFAGLQRLIGCSGGRRFADPLTSQLLVRELLRGATDPWATEMGQRPHTVTAVWRALTELRRAGITQGHFAFHDLSPGLRRLTSLLGEYEREMERAALADPAECERNAVMAVLHETLPPFLSDAVRVVVEGGTNLYGSRLDLLAALAARGLSITIRHPWDADRPAAFSWPEASLHQLESRGLSQIDLAFDNRTGRGPLQPLRAAQFSNRVAPGAPVRLVEVPNRAEYGRFIARQVQIWLSDGVPPQDIAIAVPDAEDLGRTVADELELTGIPAHCSIGEPLATGSIGTAVLLALRLPLLGFPRELLLDLWRLVNRPVATGDGQWDPPRVARWLRDAGLRSARVSLPRVLSDRAAGNGSTSPADSIRTALQACLDQLSQWPQRAPLIDHLEAIAKMLSQLGLSPPEVTVSREDPDGAQGLLRRVLLTAQANGHAHFNAFVDMMKEIHRAAELPDWQAPWCREEVLELFETSLRTCHAPVPAAPLGSVLVVPLSDLVEAEFSHLILAGIEPDRFLRVPAPDPVLTDSLRTEVNRLLGPRLFQAAPFDGRGVVQGRDHDTWLWLEALASCQEELIVTFTAPNGDPDSDRSELVDELQRSLGEQAVEKAPPAYGAPHSVDLSHLLEKWSLSRRQRATPLQPVESEAQASALADLLRQTNPDRTASIEHRITREMAIRQPGATIELLAPTQREQLNRWFCERLHNASQLDLMGVCRFKYFAAVVLGLARLEIPPLGADPREEGTAAHAALYAVYETFRQRGGLARLLADRPAALALARQIFAQNRETILAEVSVHPYLQSAVLAQAWDAVEIQLERDLKGPLPGEPIALEYRFGDRPTAQGPELVVPHPSVTDRAIRVRGSIDRVDRMGQDLLAIDYKRTYRQRSSARHYQLPLYAMAANRDLGPPAQRLRVAWRGLRDGLPHEDETLTGAPLDFEARLTLSLWQRIDELSAGNITPDPDHDDWCTGCDLRHLCRFKPTLTNA